MYGFRSWQQDDQRWERWRRRYRPESRGRQQKRHRAAEGASTKKKEHDKTGVTPHVCVGALDGSRLRNQVSIAIHQLYMVRCGTHKAPKSLQCLKTRAMSNKSRAGSAKERSVFGTPPSCLPPRPPSSSPSWLQLAAFSVSNRRL
jgi:hypothetical protein